MINKFVGRDKIIWGTWGKHSQAMSNVPDDLIEIKLNCVDYTSSHHPGVESNELYADTRNVCLLCSLGREDFEQLGISFDRHIKEEHHIWNYVFFIMRWAAFFLHGLGRQTIYKKLPGILFYM